jgi:SpoVK/Ycf46/Vps4 family AAA+-type ATPase
MNNKILYLNGRDDKEAIKSKKTFTKDEISSYINVRDRGRIKMINNIHKALTSNEPLEDADEKTSIIYETLKKKEVENNFIELPPDSKFELMPLMPKDLKEGRYRSTLFVAGESGSGKTYLCKNYLLLYSEMYPKNKIYFISQQNKDNDESLKDVRGIMEQISIEELMDEENPITWETFIDKPCLVFFDDYDGFDKHKPRRGLRSPFETVKSLIDNLLNNSRKFGVSVIVSSHDLYGAKKHETVLKECEYFCLFPEGILYDNLLYFCHKKLGLNKANVDEIKQSRSRWCIIRRRVPMMILTEYGAKILK